MLRFVFAATCLIASSISAQAQGQPPADGSSPQFHARRLGDKMPPPAKIDVMAWLAGRWQGDGLGGVSEEIWSAPAGGVMMGMYRSLKQDQAVFYEFLMLLEENGSVVLKLKHFNPDLSGWEEKRAFVSFRLVAVEPRAVHFDGLSFIRESDDALRIYLLLRDSKTQQVREEEFRMRRARLGS
jgi:hypothetical protein